MQIKQKFSELDLDRLKAENTPRPLKVSDMAFKLAQAAGQLFNLNLIGKWDFYCLCDALIQRRWINKQRISEATGISLGVIDMRIRQFRGMKG